MGRRGARANVRYDVAEIVRGFDADIVVIPEAWRSDEGEGVVDELAADGYHLASVEMMRLAERRASRSGSVPRTGTWELTVCSRFPIVDRRSISIGLIKTDPAGSRDALACTLDVDGDPFELVGVHTSSKVWLLAPVRHMRTLRRQLAPDDRVPHVIAGDFNFWGPGVSAVLPGWRRAVSGRTYPAHRPHSQIDHVLVRGPVEVQWGEVLAETPSDHRPIRTRLRIGGRVS